MSLSEQETPREPEPPKLRLLDRIRQRVLTKGYAQSTSDAYCYWAKRYILFHHKRHPSEMGSPQVGEFLSYLAEDQHVSSSTQNQALSALLFLYKEVLGATLGKTLDTVRAKQYHHLPTVLSLDEVHRLFNQMSGTSKLMAELTYGAGLRLMEIHQLRIGHLDFDARRVQVLDGKGRKDRLTLLPQGLIPSLQKHLAMVEAIHEDDLKRGLGNAVLPRAYYLKNKSASRQLRWQFVFPASGIFHDKNTGNSGRWHVQPKVLQKAVHDAADRARIQKRVTVHALRHSFATHLLQDGCDIRTIQTLLGHTNVNTTMLYAHIADNHRLATRSPLDKLIGL